MTLRIDRARQFALGDASAALFEKSGKAGGFLGKAAERLVAQNHVVTLSRVDGTALTLTTADEWKKFLSEEAPASKKETDAFAKKFGITFGDFVNVIDDVAASDEKGLKLDLSPTSELSKSLSLDALDNDYALKVSAQTQVMLTGEAGPVTAQVAGAPIITASILDTPMQAGWDRDRTEMESWADFKRGDGAADAFKSVAGPTPFVKLHQPKWNDAEAMAMVDQFALPLHLETKGTNPDGTVKFQGGSEMFRDTYYDDRDGSLTKAGASLRARVRFDNTPPFAVNRVLVQAKEGRALEGDASAVHKFEKRWEGGYTDEAAAKRMLVTGKDASGRPLEVSQKIFKLLQDKGTLPADGQLKLEPKYVVLQKRTRTHLQLDSLSEVKARRAALQAEVTAAAKALAESQVGATVKEEPAGTFNTSTDGGATWTPVKPNIEPAMQKFMDKLDQQIAFLSNSDTLLRKYGQYLPSGECFIVSADRYTVFDASGFNEQPSDIDSEAGAIAKGPFHVEAEWDTAASDPFEKAVKAVKEKLATGSTPELEADLKALEDARTTFRKDVAQTVELIKQRMLEKGMAEEPTKMSKDQRAAELAAKGKRSVNWL